MNCWTSFVVRCHIWKRLTHVITCCADIFPGHIARVTGAPTRLPRIPVWLPLQFLWCHSSQLHPNAKPYPQCLSTEHEAPRPLHAKPQGTVSKLFKTALSRHPEFISEFFFLFNQSICYWIPLFPRSAVYFMVALVWDVQFTMVKKLVVNKTEIWSSIYSLVNIFVEQTLIKLMTMITSSF